MSKAKPKVKKVNPPNSKKDKLKRKKKEKREFENNGFGWVTSQKFKNQIMKSNNKEITVKSEWIKIGECNAIRVTSIDGSSHTHIPHPLFQSELVRRGIEYFKNLKTK